VFALDIPYSWSLARTFMGREQQLSRVQPIDQRIVYEAISYPDYRTDVQMRDATTDWYIRLPPDSNPRTAELAQQMYAAAGSKENFIESVLQKFHQEEYFYTLEPPLLGNNPVDSFLFNTQQGFCEHYASAFAVMMRSVGIPARIVLGYQGGELNPKAGHLIVRQSDAHAWTEVWLAGVGWYRVDPTAAVAPERIDSGMSGSMLSGAAAAWGLSAPSVFLHDLRLSWDAINAKWNELVLGYGPDKQNELMQWLGMDDPDWRKMMLTMLALVFGMVILISLLLALRYRAPRPDRAAILYRRFVKKSGVQISVGESPASFAARARAESDMDGDAIDAVTMEYLAARYGAPDSQSLPRLQDSVNRL
jgi:transglutaminase-like putative cysteine protease